MTAFEAGAESCPQRIVMGVERRPGNALNVEIGAPMPRCRCRTPDDWGGADPRARRWLASGGTPLMLGLCSAAACPLEHDADMANKKASGENIPEAQRGTVQVKLRLPPDVADALDELAERWGLTRSGTVARLVEERTES